MSSNHEQLAEAMRDEYLDIEQQMASPEVLSRPEKLKSLGRRYAELGRVVKVYERYTSLRDDASEMREIVSAGGEDAELFRDELAEAEKAFEEAQEELKNVLIPRDPDDARDAIVEIKAGAGGEESALFAGDLLRMYQRYAESKGWACQVLSSAETDLGG